MIASVGSGGAGGAAAYSPFTRSSAASGESSFGPHRSLVDDAAGGDAVHGDPAGLAGGVDEQGVRATGGAQLADRAQGLVERLAPRLQPGGLFEGKLGDELGLAAFELAVELAPVAGEHAADLVDDVLVLTVQPAATWARQAPMS